MCHKTQTNKQTNICMSFNFTEIETEIQISFSIFIINGSVLPQKKCFVMDALSGWGSELSE